MTRKLFGTDGVRGTANAFPMTAEMALMIGAALGPLFHLISPEWGLPFCGVIAGTAAFFIDQRLGDGHG